MSTISVKELYEKLRSPGMIIATSRTDARKLVYRMGEQYVVLKRNSHGDVKSIAIWKNVPWGFDEVDFRLCCTTEVYLDHLHSVRRFLDEFEKKFGDELDVDEFLLFSGFDTTSRHCAKSKDDRWIVSRQFSAKAGYVKLSLHPDVDEWSTTEMSGNDSSNYVCDALAKACNNL